MRTLVTGRYLISVGSYIPRKAHDLTVRAFSLVAEEFKDLRLAIAGAHGASLPELQRLIDDLGLHDRVKLFVGLAPEEIAGMLSNATLVVQSAHAESFPLALLEAGAVGAPIVASGIAGHEELIFEGETGRLFEPGSITDCARVIVQALHNESHTEQMAVALRAKVIKEFTWRACVDKYLQLASV